MILVVGVHGDPIVQHLVQYLHEQGHGFIFLNQHRLGVDIFIDPSALKLPERQTIPWSELSGAYNRMVPCGSQNPGCKLQHQILSYVLDEVLTKVINRPRSQVSNCSKLNQLKLLQDCHPLLIPPTRLKANMMITPQGDAVIKSASHVRSKVQVVDMSGYCEPVIIQALVPGDNIRVHVIGEQVFATRIITEGLDYRYQEDSQHQMITLPVTVAEACQKLTQRCGLIFSGIDLIEYQGQYHLLEVNTSPGYSYFEHRCQTWVITDALVRHLLD